MPALNDFLDGIPRSHVRLGQRAVPAQFLCGFVGVVLGTIAQTLVAAAAGRSVLVSVALAPISVLGFALWMLLRRLLLRREVMVFYECAVAIVLSSSALLLGLRLPLLPYLDLLTIGICVVLACGRVGCLMAGCCYGPCSDVGLVYPHECHPHGRRVRRFPVQAFESALWVLLGVAATGLALSRPPGVALAAIALCYAVGRFFLESLRDDPRPSLFGLSESRWFALFSGTAALTFLSGSRAPRVDAPWIALGIGIAALVLLVAGRSVWLALPAGVSPAWLSELRTLGAGLDAFGSTDSPVVRHVGSLRVASSRVVTPEGTRLMVSISAGGKPLDRARAQIAFDALLQGVGANLVDADFVTAEGGLHVVTVPLRIDDDAVRTRMRRDREPHHEAKPG